MQDRKFLEAALSEYVASTDPTLQLKKCVSELSKVDYANTFPSGVDATCMLIDDVGDLCEHLDTANGLFAFRNPCCLACLPCSHRILLSQMVA